MSKLIVKSAQFSEYLDGREDLPIYRITLEASTSVGSVEFVVEAAASNGLDRAIEEARHKVREAAAKIAQDG